MTAIAPAETFPSTVAEAASPNALVYAGRGLAADLFSSLLFAGLLAVLHNPTLATGIAISAGIGQVIYVKARGRRVDALQWLSLVLVVVFGAAALVTHDVRFIMFKPTLIYCAVGVTMLSPGWMTRYVVPDALAWSRDVVVAFGYVWAAMMFATAGVNAAMAMGGDIKSWALFVTLFPVASKGGLFAVQYLTTRMIVMRRMRAAGRIA